jgi:hypothetical protein
MQKTSITVKVKRDNSFQVAVYDIKLFLCNEQRIILIEACSTISYLAHMTAKPSSESNESDSAFSALRASVYE